MNAKKGNRRNGREGPVEEPRGRRRMPRSTARSSARSEPRAKRRDSRRPIAVTSPPTGRPRRPVLRASKHGPPPAPHVANVGAFSCWGRPVAKPLHRPQRGPNWAFTWQPRPSWVALGGRKWCHFRPCSLLLASFRRQPFLSDGRTVSRAVERGVGNHLRRRRKEPSYRWGSTRSRYSRNCRSVEF
jgi:hypothetical protein